MRKINELGLKVTFEINHDLALALKMLHLLAVEKKIGDSYDMVGQETQSVCDRNCLQPEKKMRKLTSCVSTSALLI